MEIFYVVQENNQTGCVEQSGGHTGDASGDYTHIHSFTVRCVSQSAADKNILTDTVDIHLEYISFGRLIYCFLRTKMSHSLNT